eukprot:1161646-Pelagomonas_calceolata.AAC.18
MSTARRPSGQMEITGRWSRQFSGCACTCKRGKSHRYASLINSYPISFQLKTPTQAPRLTSCTEPAGISLSDRGDCAGVAFPHTLPLWPHTQHCPAVVFLAVNVADPVGRQPSRECVSGSR